MPIRAVAVAGAAVLLSVSTLSAQRETRRTWVIPHVLETSGRAGTAPDAVDTELHMVSLDRGATVDVTVYAGDGQPLRSRSGQAVCNPCTVRFASGPKQVLSLEERINAAGGFSGREMVGYAVITARGGHFLVTQHTSVAGLSIFGYQPEEVRSPPAQ